MHRIVLGQRPFALALACASGGLLASGSLHAQIVVPSATHPTIQSAINAVPPSGTIDVLPGTYTENLNTMGKALTLRSILGPAVTILDGGANGPVLTINTGEVRTTIVTGFTIRNGLNASTNVATPGGGIQLVATSPTIRDCWIIGNVGTTYGGGLGGASGTTVPCSPLIEDCRFENNSFTSGSLGLASGAGLAVFGPGNYAASVPEIRRCVFRNNAAPVRGGGAYFAYNINAVVEDCLFIDNATTGTSAGLSGGGGLYLALNSVATVRNCVFVGNQNGAVKFYNVTGAPFVNVTFASNSGGAISGVASAAVFGTNVRVDLTNCIVWQNGGTEFTFSGTDQQSLPPSATVTYSVVTNGYAGTGNLATDPRLANPASGNVRLLAGSSAIDTGNSAAANLPMTDFEGQPRVIGPAVDIGADERLPNALLLYADRGPISLSSPSTTNFTVDGGASHAGHAYAVLMSLSGITPGLDAFGKHLPLNLDAATQLGLSVFPTFSGFLNGAGTAAATMPLPALPALQGQTLSFAAVSVLASPFTLDTSNPEQLFLTL